MTFPALSAVEQALAVPTPGLSSFPCVVLRNITLEGIESYLQYAGRQDGLQLEVEWGSFDNILQDAASGADGRINERTRAIVVALWLPAFSETLSTAFGRSSGDEIARERSRLRAYCTDTLRYLRGRTSAPILWLGAEAPAWPSAGIADAASATSHRRAISEINEDYRAALSSAGNGWLIDTDLCVERVGARHAYDWRYWHMARSPFSRAGLAELAFELAKYVRALAGRTRKCLVLDCDNTLWKGILGEDGFDGIGLDAEHGGAFLDFQQEILNLHHRGVLLALCSKNNEADVVEVLRDHRGMLLREDHLAARRINWTDKVTNLRELAAELNIGLDSLVFVDDSQFEIHAVKAALPEVATILVDPEKMHEARTPLASSGWFDALAITDADRTRNDTYRAENARRALRETATDLSTYLKSLEMRLIIREVGETDLDRAAQLCQRTNQFNLTTRRHTRDELEGFLRAGNHRLYSARLTDRFGDYGTIGLCLLALDGQRATIDTFLLSCRALGRGVETGFLAVCAAEAAERGAKILAGSYIPTKKNGQVAGFYPAHGFAAAGASAGESRFELALRSDGIPIPEHLIISQTDE